MTTQDNGTPLIRPRRLRQHPVLRQLTQEHAVTTSDLILPLFVTAAKKGRDIASMPGHRQLSLNELPTEIEEIQSLGIAAVILFGIPEQKDAHGTSSLKDKGIVQQAIRCIKAIAPELLVIADVCFCEYTNHGHCGIWDEESQTVCNDRTLKLLQQQAVSMAQAGADVIAPSGMMDGMVGALRFALDAHHFASTPILSYAVKYASSCYGPFREAANGAPQFGDRKTYQMNPANSNEAILEAQLDVVEGADILMVKPAQFYLDVIYRIKQEFAYKPLCAYQVSGEFAMIQAAAQSGWIDGEQVIQESLLSIKRAGADMIITYFAKTFARLQLG